MFCPASRTVLRHLASPRRSDRRRKSSKRTSSNRRVSVVVLIHGLAVGKGSMKSLERYLRGTEFATVNWSYPSLGAGIDAHGRALSDFLEQLDDDDRVSEINIVTHSMGGVVTRCALVSRRPRKLGRVLMLTPPNRGAGVANIVGALGGFLVKPVRQLTDSECSFVRRLPTELEADVGIVAASDDVVVRPRETFLNSDAKYALVPGGHASVLTDPKVAACVRQFLRTGGFGRYELPTIAA